MKVARHYFYLYCSPAPKTSTSVTHTHTHVLILNVRMHGAMTSLRVIAQQNFSDIMSRSGYLNLKFEC